MVSQPPQTDKPNPKMMISRWNAKGVPLSPRIILPSEDPVAVLTRMGFKKKDDEQIWRKTGGFTAVLHEAKSKNNNALPGHR